MIFDILNSIVKTGSTKEKERLLKEQSENELLKRVYRLAYHPQIQFGIKKIPEYVTGITLYNLVEALDFLENHLATRKCTGNNAIARVSQILSGMRDSDAEVIKRIIGRDLECGASSTIANKVWKDLIPKQPQMLASAYSEKALKNIVFPAYAQLKADGARAFAEIRGFERDDVKLFSRAGNEYLRLDKLKDDLIEVYKKVADQYPNGICVDGELVYVPESKKLGLDFLMDDSTQTENVSMRSESNGFANKSLKNTITESESSQMSYQVWDLIPLDTIYGIDKGSTYLMRFLELKDSVVGMKRLILIENTLVHNIEEAKVIYKQYVEMGLEGIILKNREAFWENKRSKHLVKFKEEITLDLRIVGFVPHTKEPNKIGSFILESECGRIKVKSGSGLRDTDAVVTNEVGEDGEFIWKNIPIQERHDLNRAKLFANWDSIKDTIVELKCNGFITAEGRTDSVSLFLPIISELRIDKTEANTFAEMFPDSKFVFVD